MAHQQQKLRQSPQQQPQAPARFLQTTRLSAGANLASHDHHNHRATAKPIPVPPSATSQQQQQQQQQHFKGHQRRQSVARLLPDISKLRLLSWLVEASSELINCDIAIMDGVYAKLNRSRESLLFWQQQGQVAAAVAASRAPPARPPPPSVAPVASGKLLAKQQQQQQLAKQRVKSGEKSTSSGAASESKHHEKSACSASLSSAASRNHHSLPLTNYDASSLAAVSLRSSVASSTIGAPTASGQFLAAPTMVAARHIKDHPKKQRQQLQQLERARRGAQCASLPIELFCDTSSSTTASGGGRKRPKAAAAAAAAKARDSSQLAASDADASENTDDDDEDDEEEEDDDEEEDDEDEEDAQDDKSTSSAASSSEASTTSSGIHGAASLSSGSSCASSDTASSFGDTGFSAAQTEATAAATQLPQPSSSEQLSERIRRSVVEHNYLQTLLVNVIRQHDRKLAYQNHCRRRHESNLLPRIDLAELADSLDDGCLCACHQRSQKQLQQMKLQQHQDRSSSLPANQPVSSTMSSTLSLLQPKQRKLRRKLKGAATTGGGSNADEQLSREDMLQKFSNKLCESCFETHYWLHSCSQFAPLEFASTLGDASASSTATTTQASKQQTDNLNSVIALRNATFIKLVQQQVRSTISKSIELIDLIRKEIKSPESIKQKQLMRCFSASVQLLTSVANYVVPTQDISSFIPNELASSNCLPTASMAVTSAAGQQQTNLFNLPPGDFDHLLFYQSSAAVPNLARNGSASGNGKNPNNNRSSPYSSISPHLPSFNYHLASAPEIPIRQRNRSLQLLEESSSSSKTNLNDNSSASLEQQQAPPARSSGAKLAAQLEPARTRSHDNSNQSEAEHQAIICAASNNGQKKQQQQQQSETAASKNEQPDSSSGASSNNSSASSSIARGTVQQSSLTRAHTSGAILPRDESKQQLPPSHHDLTSMISSYDTTSSLNRHNPRNANDQHDFDFLSPHASKSPKFWHSSKFNFIKKLLQVKQQRLLRQQSKDRRIYNNKVQNKFRLVMMDLTHFNKSQQLLTTENGVNSLLTSMRNVLEFGLYLTVKLY